MEKNNAHINNQNANIAEQNANPEKTISNAELQAFYNEAYISERERLNSMFGRVDTYPVAEKEVVYRDPDYSNFVPMKKYKKKSTAAAVLGILFAIAAIGAGVLAYLHFFAN